MRKKNILENYFPYKALFTRFLKRNRREFRGRKND